MRQPHALVVGGSGEIGRATAAELADLGFSLTLGGRDPGRPAAAACSTPEVPVGTGVRRHDVKVSLTRPGRWRPAPGRRRRPAGSGRRNCRRRPTSRRRPGSW